jgi:outer membrane immunogenic protein
MKKLFVVTTILSALAGSHAVAADLPTKGPAPVVVRPGCAQFGGFYVGGNAGWASNTNRWSDRDAWSGEITDDLLRGNVSTTNNGFIGGVQGGYNWQTNCTVFGVEADYSWSNVKNSTLETDGDVGVDVDTLTIESRLRGLGTLRTRAGVVVDNLLIYVTGGVALGNFKRTYTQTDNNVPVSEVFQHSNNRWGWVLGVGTEWAINQNWSIKGEALYHQFKSDDTTFVCTAFCAAEAKRFSNEDSVWVGRIGFNYRFSAVR